MEVVFHAHNAIISDRMKQRASRGLLKLSKRLDRVVDALVRFHQDGPIRRVEIRLNAAGHRDLIAEGSSRYYGPALRTALTHLESQMSREKRETKHPGPDAVRA